MADMFIKEDGFCKFWKNQRNNKSTIWIVRKLQISMPFSISVCPPAPAVQKDSDLVSMWIRICENVDSDPAFCLNADPDLGS